MMPKTLSRERKDIYWARMESDPDLLKNVLTPRRNFVFSNTAPKPRDGPCIERSLHYQKSKIGSTEQAET